MTSSYESATSGMNFDRFTDELISESTLTKMQQHFWTAKQFLRTKLGKKEDDFLLASDADFDTKIGRFVSIRDTTRGLLCALEDCHHLTNGLAENERDLGAFLSRQSRNEKPHVAKAMQMVGSTHIDVVKSRIRTAKPLLRLFRDLETFNDRAIADCSLTVEAAEKARVEYRGSLMWMKKMSEELDPDTDTQMDKYRTTQTVVRTNKERLDKLKEDTLQKVDLLELNRSTVLREATAQYLLALNEFESEAAAACSAVLDDLLGIDSYEIDVLKILNDPAEIATEANKPTEPPKIEADLFEDILLNETNSRPDSPLGILQTDDECLIDVPSTSSAVGPLAPLPIDSTVPIPLIPKPPSSFVPTELFDLTQPSSNQQWSIWLEELDKRENDGEI